MIIILVVGGVTVTIFRYAREIVQTRDEVQILNVSLEQRVRSRTTDLIAARDKAEVLLAEVNHRVANSLSMVSALVRLQSNGIKDQAAKDALERNTGADRCDLGGAQVALQFGRRTVRRFRSVSFGPSQQCRNIHA